MTLQWAEATARYADRIRVAEGLVHHLNELARFESARVPQRTLKELEEAVSYFRIAPATIERVQRVLVDGEAVSVVARGDNLTYQPLARTCNKVMDKVEELRSNAPVLVPPGWEEATIVAPVEFIAETRKRLERYLLDKGWKKSIA